MCMFRLIMMSKICAGEANIVGVIECYTLRPVWSHKFKASGEGKIPCHKQGWVVWHHKISDMTFWLMEDAI